MSGSATGFFSDYEQVENRKSLYWQFLDAMCSKPFRHINALDLHNNSMNM